MPATFASDALSGGFADPVFEAQAAFRSLLAAMAEPARPVPCPARATAPAPMPPLMATLALTLADADTPVWMDGALSAGPQVARWLAFHTGAPLVSDPAAAAFAFVLDARRLPPLSGFARGTAEYPDRSATVIVAVDGFADDGPSFDGPGFEAPRRFSPRPASPHLAAEVARNREGFPLGVDLVFVGPDAVACLPRSVRLAGS